MLRCLAEGHSNKVIANKIDIAVATVKVHVNSIFRKIGTSNRTQAAIWARTNIPQEEPAENRAILPAPASAAAAAGPSPRGQRRRKGSGSGGGGSGGGDPAA